MRANQKNMTKKAVAPVEVKKSAEKTEKQSFKSWWKNAKWAFNQMLSLSKRDTFLIIFLSIAKAAVPTLSAYVFSRIFNEIVLYLGDFATQKPVVITDYLVFLLATVALLQFVGAFIQRAFRMVDLNFRIVHLKTFDNLLVERIASLDYQYFEDPEVSNLIQKAKDNSWKVREFIGVFLDLLTLVVTVIIAGVISFKISPVLTIILIILSLPSNFAYKTFIRQWWDVYHKNIESSRFIGWSKSTLTNNRDVAEHRITGSSKMIIDDIRDRSNLVNSRELKVHKDRFIKDILLNILSAFTTFGVYIYLILEVIAGRITSIGDFSFYQNRMSDFSSQVGSLAGLVTDLTDAGNGLDQVIRLFELDDAIKWGNEKLASDVPPTIEFKNVWFKYPKSKAWVFRNLNFTVKPGEEIAIVGENGAGKTTLVRLLMRFYDPDKGVVLVNGKDIKRYSKSSYFYNMSALFQEYNGYGHYDVTKNIIIGRADKKIDKKLLLQSVKYAEADKFIDKLENKYDQVLNKQFTGGTNISGGQWQKIAIARMFYRNAPVLVLDEPTASIDAVSEYKIFRRIYKFIKGKTVIIISHRFSTVKSAQCIYILHNGKIVEQGSHKELMALNGRYAKAFNLQAGGYSEDKE